MTDEEFLGLKSDFEAFRLETKAKLHAQNTLLVVMLRSLHEAGIQDLFALRERTDAQHVLAASRIAISGDDAKTAEAGLAQTLSLLKDASHKLRRRAQDPEP